MRIAILLLLSLSLGGCIASNTVVRSQAMSFDDIIEDTTDKLLVLNILRAKDKAPLHFDEIPSIHESVTGNASVQGVWPFGPSNKGTARNTITAGVGIQLAPSFELDNLATKDFVTGMSTPIDPKFVKYWLDRGLDRRVVLLLFFSAIDVTVANSANGSLERHTIRIRNSPRDAIDALYATPTPIDNSNVKSLGQRESDLCKGQTDFQHYLKLINNLTSFTAQSAPQKKPILEEVPVDNSDLGRILASVASLDSSKTSVTYNKDSHTISMYGISAPKTELCLSRVQALGSSGTQEAQNTCNGADVATTPNVTVTPSVGTTANAGATPGADSDRKEMQDIEDFPEFRADEETEVKNFCDNFGRAIEQLHPPEKQYTEMFGNPQDPKPQIRMEIRSVGEIIQFLGDLMAYQEAIQAYDKEPGTNPPRVDISLLNPVVTFGFCAYSSEPHCGDYFFNVRSDGEESYRFALTYRGQRYYVPRYSRPEQWQSIGIAPCSQGTSRPGSDPSCVDHTLEILAVVNQLTDLQRSAQDVQQTPYVSVLP
jgi:hypothetical protein